MIKALPVWMSFAILLVVSVFPSYVGDARKLATLEAFMGEGYVGTWCWGNKIKNHAMPPLSFLTGALVR